jgi:hypothetical protein
VVTRFRPIDRTPDYDWQAATITTTVFAVREDAKWVFSGALFRRTRSWRREAVGRINYVIEPSYPFSAARAERSLAWADSVATALAVPALGQLTYYVAGNRAQIYHAMGVESDSVDGLPGGSMKRWRNQPLVFSGDPVFGEAHRHELAHILLVPLMTARTTGLASEAVAGWLGGTAGMDFPTATGRLGEYLDGRPEVTLDSLIAASGNRWHIPAGALLCAMVHARGGDAAVRQFLDSGPSMPEFRLGMERVFGQPWPAIAAEWRRQALARRQPTR